VSDLTRILEERLANSWPALDVRLADGWMLRFAGGYSKRANSASAVVPGAGLDPDLVAHVAAAYRARGLPAVFRLTGVEAPGADAVLAGLGFREVEPTLALVADLAAGPGGPDPAPDPAVDTAPAADEAWIAAACGAYGGEKADGTGLKNIVSRIDPPAAFGRLTLDGRPLAWGLAVAERGDLGLSNIVVHPDARGRGLGRRLVEALVAWGAGAGAARAYLQVRDTNAAAIGLYRSMGFREAYAYRHRVLPIA
jgi:N-acetylglutamate synthase